MPDADILRSIAQFLYREARLLDERRFHDWLQLFTDDIRYSMVARANRYPRSSKAIAILDPASFAEEDLDNADALGLFDEDIRTLTARVARLDTGMAWAEDPPSWTRHLITNIEVVPEAAGPDVTAYSNFIVYRSRGETEQDFYVGTRKDRLRPIGNAWKIACRRMVLDQNVLTAKNLSIFF